MAVQSADQVKIPQAIWIGLTALGIRPAEALRQARLPAALVAKGSALSTEQFFGLWQAIGQLTADPAAGIKLVTGIDPSQLPPSLIAAYHARDLRDALARVARFKHLCSPELLHVTEDGDTCVVEPEWVHADREVPELLVDATFGALVELARKGTRTELRPVRVELKRGGGKSEAQRKFYGCPVRFRSTGNRLVFRREDLDLSFASYNAELVEMLTPQLELASKVPSPKATASEQVRRLLRQFLSAGRPEIEAVAKDLGMSGRTLQRRIEEEGSTFRDLLSQARRELAQEYLGDPTLDLKEIVYLLGYEDAPSFYRAFRHWEGTTPALWRSRRSGIENVSLGSSPGH